MSSAPEIRTPRDLVDLRTWLCDQWQVGHTYDRCAAPLLAGRTAWDVQPNKPAAYSYWERTNLKQSTLWWVAAEMVDLLIATAQTIPDDVRYEDLTPPSPSGLVIFEKPWIGIDAEARGEVCQVDAINWGGSLLPPMATRDSKQSIRAISATAYRHIDFDEGMTGNVLQHSMLFGCVEHMVDAGSGSLKMFDDEKSIIVVDDDLPIERGDEIDLQEIIREVQHRDAITSNVKHGTHRVTRESAARGRSIRAIGHSWLPLGRSDWPRGDRIGDPPWPMDDNALASYVEDRKVLAALWSLLRESGIARTETHHVDRAVRRRAERAGFKPEQSAIQVVTLRKLNRTQGTDDGTEIKHSNYSHRFLVDGHFAWRACGKGWKDRRLTFIHPYIKGPDDKPFQPKIRVNAWRR